MTDWNEFLKSLAEQSATEQYTEACKQWSTFIYAYYTALIASGFTAEAAEKLLLQWHQLLWTKLYFGGIHAN